MMIVAKMFARVLAMKFAVTAVVSMDPMAMFAMPPNPDVFVPAIPITRDAVVKPMIADIDIKADRVGVRHH